MHHQRLIVRLAAVAGCVALAVLRGHAGDEPEDRKGRFVRISDPGTIVVTRFNREHFFKLLGVHPYTGLSRSDPLELEATSYLTTVLADKRLVLTLDETAPLPEEEFTSAGYLFLDDGTFVNAEVLKRGYGQIDERTPFARLEEFRSYQKEARDRNIGLWPIHGSLSEISCSDLTVGYVGFCGVTAPRLIPGSKVQPKYPRKARMNGIEGRVVLTAVITKDGSVTSIRPLRSPHSDLTDAAIAAASQWRYEPGLLDGRPINVQFTILVEFRIARGPW